MNQRERFEAWAAANSLNTVKHAGEYSSTPTYMAWLAWQAGSDAEREACAKVCDEMRVPAGVYYENAEAHDGMARSCAERIRARGDK